jgi:hypothetical protein
MLGYCLERSTVLGFQLNDSGSVGFVRTGSFCSEFSEFHLHDLTIRETGRVAAQILIQPFYLAPGRESAENRSIVLFLALRSARGPLVRLPRASHRKVRLHIYDCTDCWICEIRVRGAIPLTSAISVILDALCVGERRRFVKKQKRRLLDRFAPVLYALSSLDIRVGL